MSENVENVVPEVEETVVNTVQEVADKASAQTFIIGGGVVLGIIAIAFGIKKIAPVIKDKRYQHQAKKTRAQAEANAKENTEKTVEVEEDSE